MLTSFACSCRQSANNKPATVENHTDTNHNLIPLTQTMNSNPFALLILLIAVARATAACEVVLAVSTFDDALVPLDGWQGINNDGGREILERLEHPDGAGGYIQLREDAGDSATMVFLAPPKFLGDQHLAYGGRLVFRLKQYRTDQFYSAADVTLVSGGICPKK